MEYFYQELQHDEITLERINERRKKVPELIQKAFNHVMFHNPEYVIEYKGMQKVILSIIV